MGSVQIERKYRANRAKFLQEFNRRDEEAVNVARLVTYNIQKVCESFFFKTNLNDIQLSGSRPESTIQEVLLHVPQGYEEKKNNIKKCVYIYIYNTHTDR